MSKQITIKWDVLRAGPFPSDALIELGFDTSILNVSFYEQEITIKSHREITIKDTNRDITLEDAFNIGCIITNSMWARK